MRFISIFIALLIPAGFALADVACPGGFCPIQALPNVGPGGGIATQGDLTTYLNALFQLALAAGAALSVIFIAIGGFEYIFSEAMENKHDGRLRITNALYGLAILLLVTMILYIINPDAICLEVFSNNGTCQ